MNRDLQKQIKKSYSDRRSQISKGESGLKFNPDFGKGLSAEEVSRRKKQIREEIQKDRWSIFLKAGSLLVLAIIIVLMLTTVGF